ncbi:MAG TPA: hypothetical protein VGD67_24455 [Pseudonocardiaceae bacterium]
MDGDPRIGEIIRGSVLLSTTAGLVRVEVRESTAAWLDVGAPGPSTGPPPGGHGWEEAADSPAGP